MRSILATAHAGQATPTSHPALAATVRALALAALGAVGACQDPTVPRAVDQAAETPPAATAALPIPRASTPSLRVGPAREMPPQLLPSGASSLRPTAVTGPGSDAVAAMIASASTPMRRVWTGPSRSLAPTPAAGVESDVFLVWQHETAGAILGWKQRGGTRTGTVDYGAVPVQWRIVGAGDFNLDAHEDLVWRNVNTGDLTIWMMRNGAIASFHTVGGVPTVWEVEGIGFLNYDGYSDLVWRNRTTGDVIYWFMRGTSIMQSISIGAVPTAWRVVGVGNVPRGTTDPFHSTRDAQNDVMWYNQTSGEVLVWTDRVFEQGVYNPGTYETLSLGAVPTNWYIEATGDYDGDGDTDIMWRNGAGALLVWTLQNGALAQIGDLGAVPTAWKLRTMLKPNRSFQMTRVAGAAAGDHFCGTAAAGEVYCWGDNRARQLGTAASTWTFLGNQIQFSNTPVRAAGAPTNVTGFALGQAYSCALTGAGSVHCWGTGPFPTPSGDGYTPTLQSGIPALASIAGGQSHACGLTSAGAAWCWGWNGSGQLGNALSTNTSGASNPARAVDGGLTFTALASGSEHTCGLTSTGQAYCWGRNDVGQLGDGSTANKAAPTLVTGGRTFSQLTAGHRSTCGRATDGSTYCWGTVYQEGNAPIGTFTAPRLIANSSGFSTIAGAGYVTCGLRGGQAFCWGLNNGEGIVGDNTFFNIREGATAVEGPARFSALAGSFGATCGLTSDGTAYCWGNNEFGDAGTAGVPLALAPMPVLTR